MKKRLSTLAIATLFFALAFLPLQKALSHCQIPCGIYDDEMRFEMIAEHVATIEKSMKQILELEKATPVNYNQIVRWINNKDHHADQLAEIVSYYFLAQRVKPYSGDDEEASHAYGNQLALLHQMIVSAMKAKQTTDLTHVDKLRSLLEEFRRAYFGPEKMEHGHQH